MNDRDVLKILVKDAERFRRTPIVDDDFPAYRDNFDATLLATKKHLENSTGLDLSDLRSVNLKRAETKFGGLQRWSPMEWAAAMAGECGEACNVTKKIWRLDNTPQWNSPEEQDAAALKQDLADEIADVLIYADLLAARLGIDLSEAVRQKFNRTSAKVGSDAVLVQP
jgi:NTP pyrophosphatase (non-canonical NTP hydrolase)